MISPTSLNRSIVLTVDGHVARITLNRPDRHNALESEDIQAFRSALATVSDDDGIRALVVTGAGSSTFCAGASLKQLNTGEMSGAVFDTLTDDLASLRVPTVCAVNGGAYGGGAEIALCCDFRIGVTTARLSVPAARLGICYPIGGLERYVQRLGLDTARRLLVANEELTATEMLEIGFLHRVVEPEALSDATDALADRLASLAPLAVQGMKRILGEIASGTLDEEGARETVERCMASQDLQEGLRAQRAGEDPRFQGR
ncbi:MAG: enoyl-CoA hydratase/isomerase family protein [Gemmatimonadota bacterium]|nr:enoyl-CoA hydratase/isomerase family protein [Gemmatimonadota bacterium]